MDWKVSKETIEVFPHTNAEKLSIGKVGQYQIVFNTEQGGYKTGDTVVFIPEKSILPDNLKVHWEEFLKGSNKDRVGMVKLRGEISQGIVLNLNEARKIMGDVIDSFEIGNHIANELNITKYEPPIPQHLMGTVKGFDIEGYKKHDCAHYSAYESQFVNEEIVIVTEKLHGSLVNIHVDSDKKITLTSKGLANRGLSIEESESNTYWQALKNTFDIATFPCDSDFQIIGEVIPVQRGYSYDQVKPVIKVFRYIEKGVDISYGKMPEIIRNNFVPVIFIGPLDKGTIRQLAEGKETVSGKQLHIREGVVVSPINIRKARDTTNLYMKIINSKYKEDDDSFN